MSQNNNRISLSQLVTELKRMCQKGDSGKLYVSTNKNTFSQIGLKEGKIVAISYGSKKGTDALDALVEIESATIVFMPVSTYAEESMALPPNEDIFNRLNAASPVVASPDPVAELPQEFKEKLQQTLANYIGPMANTVCAQVLPTTSDIHAAITALAAQIPDSERARAFQTESLKKF